MTQPQQISVELIAKIDGYVRNLKQASTATEAQTKAIGMAFSGAEGAVKGLTGALTAAMVVDYASYAINSVDALNDLRDATGGSIENLSALEDIATRTGTSMDTVSTAMVKFNGVLKDAKPGSDAHAALSLLNLDVAELRNLDPAEALLKTATALAGYADDGHKARIMQELFGKSLKDVAPFLKDLAEKGELVAKVTTAQAEEAEKFNKQLFAMQKNVLDLSREIAGPLVSSLNKTLDLFKQGRKEGLSFREVMANQQWAMIRDWVDAPNSAQEYAQRLGEISEKLKENNLHESRRASLIREQASLQAKLSTHQNYSDSNQRTAARILREGTSDKPSLPDKPDKDKDKKTSKKDQISEASRALATYIEGLERVILKNDNLTEQEKALNFLRTIGATGEIAQVRELTLGMAAQIDKEKEREDQLKVKRQLIIDEGMAVEKANEAYQAMLTRLYAATPQFNLEAQRKDVVALTEEFEAGRISESLYLEAVSARLDLTVDKTDKAKTAAEELGLTFASAFEDAIVSGKDLSTVIDGLINDIMRMVVRRSITEPMANFISAGIGSMLPSFAVGTNYVPQDMVAKIHKGEKITPAAQNNTSSGAAPIYVTQNFTVGDVASVSMVRQAVAGSERRIAAGIGRSLTYGGALA